MLQDERPEVDFTLVNGHIRLMLRNCSKVLPRDVYRRLEARINAEKSYLEQKKIFDEYVKVIINK